MALTVLCVPYSLDRGWLVAVESGWYSLGFIEEAQLSGKALTQAATTASASSASLPSLQGYLAHKKQPPPLGPP